MSLAAALAATNLTSCIDNDEPDGIAALRQAKSEYIKAETAVKNAEAEKQTLENQLIEYRSRSRRSMSSSKIWNTRKLPPRASLRLSKSTTRRHCSLSSWRLSS